MDVETKLHFLKTLAAQYDAGNPFKVGDMVVCLGEPEPRDVYVVLKATQGNAHTLGGKSNGKTFGRRLDMRIAWVGQKGKVASCWTESWMYAPWRGVAPTPGEGT